MIPLGDKFTKTDRFLIGAELVSARGPLKPVKGDKLNNFVEGLCSDKRVDWISVTDNAGGNPMQAPLTLGKTIQENGKPAVIHISCKDYNRNGLESLAWMYAAEGLDNLLVLTGDYPIDGHEGIAQPVFDIDSVGLLKHLTDMNNGIKIECRKPGSTMELGKSNFFLGCTVSPFKTTEAEQIMQYQKYRAKADAGAHFVIPQIGYDIRKSHELYEYNKMFDINLPLIGNIYKLSYGVAKIFNRGLIPGCLVSDNLLERIEKERKSDDKGKKFYLRLAAMQLAAFKKIGYKGGYVGGVASYSAYSAILETAEGYAKTSLTDLTEELSFPQEGGFYFFGLDSETGLSEVTEKNPLLNKRVKKQYKKSVTFGYRFSLVVHSLAFSKKSPLFRLGKPFFTFLEKHERLNRIAYFNERLVKAAIFECRECGDCSLADIAYLCPQSQCVKNQRNGPCGGSLNDKCELTKANKDCIWVRAYNRKRYFNRDIPELLNRPPIIKDGRLKNTSGWANFFLERDHFAKTQKGLDYTNFRK